MLENGRLVELKLDREGAVLGNIYKGRVVNVVRGLDAAFVDCGIERNAFVHVADALPEEPSRRQMTRKMESLPPIGQVLREGQELLLQVTKGPVGAKGPRGTCRISLPGRYLVLMAQGGTKVGVSKRIEDEQERERLRALGEKVRPDGYAIIIRTRAEGAGQKELEADVRLLLRLWESIQRRARRLPTPALVHEDLSLVFEIVRDVFSTDIDRFIVDDSATYDKVLIALDTLAPQLRSQVEQYKETEPVFTRFGIEAQLDRALHPKVWLPHGGTVHIEQTEALTSIDVNTGKFTKGHNLAETVLRTNLEAAEEIGRQLRLRDIGGIIVIDFIDMDSRNHRRQVMAKFKEVLKADRMKTRVVHLTPLGLVEMTRKRTGDSLPAQLLAPCPACEGQGRVWSPESMAARAEERLRELAAKDDSPAFLVNAHPLVCLQLIGKHGAGATQLEEELGRDVYIRANSSADVQSVTVAPGKPEGLKRAGLPHTVDEAVEIRPEHVLALPSETLIASVNGYIVEVPDHSSDLAGPLNVRLTQVEHSYARAAVVKRRRRRRRPR